MSDILESTCTKFVWLLWKEHKPYLQHNQNLAISRIKCIEHDFKKDPTLASTYKEAIKDYIDIGLSTKLTPEEVSSIKPFTNYIPHHAVSNNNKPNKIRAVFDAVAEYQNS